MKLRLAHTPDHDSVGDLDGPGQVPRVRQDGDRTIGNLAAANLGQPATAAKRSLKKIQYRPHLADGCLAGTGLAMNACP
ncbi:hypothetical protein ACF08M_20320 [Streptomyces sp. NPDC015032]|uniref:hypothetical protein n=1 Tax=Streptomyces sp. NPDC015032 TaxID=3364937 RepID=UPI0036F80C89